MKAQTILDFWFKELKPKDWFIKNLELDQLIKNRFYNIHQQAKQGELWHWRTQADSSLAEIIILDQFSRNIYRNQTGAFSCDSLALALSQAALEKGWHQKLSSVEKGFLYMPFMHSESALIHKEAMKLYSEPGLENNLDYEQRHKKIIDRFGRYPHRNEILGRSSTPEEILFLKEAGSSF